MTSEATSPEVELALGGEALAAEAGAMVITDLSSIPAEPGPEAIYRHRPPLPAALRELWSRRDIMFTLAERDIRANYKQAALGLLWSVINPVIQLVLFTVIFNHVKAFSVTKGLPYALFVFTGITCWSYFSQSLVTGGNAVVNNMLLVQKTHFPREAFPLSQMLEASFYTAVSLVPFAILFYLHSYAPKPQIYWVPLLILIEVMFVSGVTLGFAAAIIYVRDLQQVMNIIVQLGMFATPVIWPFSKLPVSWKGLPLRGIYSVINPLGPVIDNVRRTMLLGQSPEWNLVGLAAASAALYMVGGYLLFKRLEASFADIA